MAALLDEDFADGTYDPADATVAFVDGMKAPFLDRERPTQALSRNAAATNPNHTLELDVADVTAPTTPLWGDDDEIGTDWPRTSRSMSRYTSRRRVTGRCRTGPTPTARRWPAFSTESYANSVTTGTPMVS